MCVFFILQKNIKMRYTDTMNNLSPNLQSILDNRLRYLPEIVGKAINHIDWASSLITIGKSYGIHVDEMEEFQLVVLKSLTGMISPDQFENEIISATAVSPATAEKMIHDINEKILEPIHDFILNDGALPAVSEKTILEQASIDVQPVAPEDDFVI